MKKTFAIIGLALHIVYFILALLSLGDYEYAGYGFSTAFKLWIYATIIAIPIIALYLIDAIFTVAVKRNLFSLIKLGAVILCIPLFVFIGATAGTIYSIIGNCFFCATFYFRGCLPVCTERYLINLKY